MGVEGYYADSRSAQEVGDGSVSAVIPADVAEELGIDDESSVLFRMSEGDDHAVIQNPDRSSVEVSIPESVEVSGD